MTLRYTQLLVVAPVVLGELRTDDRKDGVT